LVAALLTGLLAVALPVSASTLATLEVSTSRVRAGDEVSFRGWYYNDVKPVVIRWNALDGPVLATVTPDTFGVVHNHFRSIAGILRIPPDAQPGTHVLLATQEFAPPGKITWGVPVRTEIHVGDGAGQSNLGTVRRPRALSAQTVPDGPALVAAGAVGAALAGILVGLAVLVRRRSVTP
jgi:hypothetical protein